MFPLITAVVLMNESTDNLQQMMTTLQQQTYQNLSIVVVSSQQQERFNDVTIIAEEQLLPYLRQSETEYVTFVDARDTLFEVTIEKLYHAAALTESTITMGNYADYHDGQYYFYSWGGDWTIQTLSQGEFLQKNATSDTGEARLYGALYGKLFHRKTFEQLEEWCSAQLTWRLAMQSSSVAYLNYPTYVYTPRYEPVSAYYDESIMSFQYLMQAAQSVEGFSLDEAKRHYCQQLANYHEWLKNEGEMKASERVYDMLVTAENGMIPVLDLPALDFTIISNNCVGGLIYKQMGLPYRTPFVGLFILPEDYYKLTKNFHYYMEQELVFDEELHYFSKDNIYYPVGHLDDVTLHFLHYASVEDARTKWNRRKSRMNWKNVYFKFDDKDGATIDLLHKIDALPYDNKIILVHRDYQLESQVIVPGYEALSEVGIINYPIQTFDVMSWLRREGNDLSGGII